MGPDEFHEKLPGSDVGGLTDNAYSNIMVSWMLDKSFQSSERTSVAEHRDRILEAYPFKEAS